MVQAAFVAGQLCGFPLGDARRICQPGNGFGGAAELDHGYPHAEGAVRIRAAVPALPARDKVIPRREMPEHAIKIAARFRI